MPDRLPLLLRPLVLALVLVACGGNGKKEPAGKEPGGNKEPAPAPAPAPAPTATPEELYEKCRDRMEKPEADGECTSDSDCASAGCNQEVCVTVPKSKDLNTTCDAQPCFKVADTCGCHDGKCTWTLKKEAPAGSGLGNKLPPSPN